MDVEHAKDAPQTDESRRGFLKKSGKVAAGAAILPIVMTLRADKARAWGSGHHYSGSRDGGSYGDYGDWSGWSGWSSWSSWWR